MIVTKGITILVDPIDIIYRLKEDVDVRLGKQLFGSIKPSYTDVMFSCPFHSDGQEKSPSCGMSTKAKGDKPAGLVNCFACGHSSTLEVMIGMIFQNAIPDNFGHKWLVKMFVGAAPEERQTIEFTDTRAKPKVEYISEEELDSYRFYHDYMYQRGLNDYIIHKYDVGFDRHFKLGNNSIPSLTFPVRDRTGQTLFIARRSVQGKVFHYPTSSHKPVYGVYELPPHSDAIYVCEGILDALTAVKYGVPAVALLGLGSKPQYEQLKRLQTRELVLALDNDHSGNVASKQISNALSGFKICSRLEIQGGKDINDLSEKQFKKLEISSI